MPNGTFGSMTPEDPVPTRQLNGDPGEGLRDERASPNTGTGQRRFQPSAASGMGPIFAGSMQDDEQGILERLLGVPGAARQRIADFVAPDPVRDQGMIGGQAAQFDPGRFPAGAFEGDLRTPRLEPEAITGIPDFLREPVPQPATQPDTVPGPGPIDPASRGEVLLGVSGIVGVPGAGRGFRAVEAAPGAVVRAGRAVPDIARATPGALRSVPGRAGSAVDELASLFQSSGRVERGQLNLIPSGRPPRGPGPGPESPGVSPGDQLSRQRSAIDDLIHGGSPQPGPGPSTLQGIQAEMAAVNRAIAARNARIAATNRPTIPEIQPTGIAADFLGQAQIPTATLRDPTIPQPMGATGMSDLSVGGGVTGGQVAAPASIMQSTGARLQVPGLNQLFNPNTFAAQRGREFIGQPGDVIQGGRGAQRQPGLTANTPRFDVPQRITNVPPRAPPARVPPRTPRIPGIPPGLPPLGFGGGGVFGPGSRRRFPFGFVNMTSPAFPGTNIRVLPNGQLIQLPDPGEGSAMQPRDPVTGQFVEA